MFHRSAKLKTYEHTYNNVINLQIVAIVVSLVQDDADSLQILTHGQDVRKIIYKWLYSSCPRGFKNATFLLISIRPYNTRTHSILQGIMRHYVCSPAVWGLPGSVYLHSTELGLSVVDDLWDLPVFHWCTVVISRWTKKEKCCLGPHCWFLGQFLQPLCAVMRIWALQEETETGVNEKHLHSFTGSTSKVQRAQTDL